MNHRHLKILLLVMFFAGLLFSCSTTYNTINNRDFIDKYNPNGQQMHPTFAVFMKSANEHRLYFRIFPTELAYIKPEGSKTQQASISIFFRVTENYSSIQIIDSLTKTFTLKGKPRQQFMGFIPINFPSNENYVIEAFLTDLNSAQTVSQVLDIEVSSAGTENSFVIMSKHASPIFRPYISVTDTFKVRSDMFYDQGIKISYYKAESELPIPPDLAKETILIESKADSTITLSSKTAENIPANKQGVMLLSDKQNKVSRTIGVFHEHYPYVKTSSQLLQPLAYLCEQKEMDGYWEQENLKQAVDSFWLATAGDMDKAKELIRVYYNRIQLANYYFSDYREGWLTDRGMIYTICGAPATTKLEEEGEYWIYGKGNGLQFFFNKEKHPTFGKIYTLHRTDSYSRIWFNAVGTWRDGRIFSLNP